MKEVLKKLRVLEAEMEEAENQSEYWMEEEHLDMKKSDSYEAEADRLYQEVYKMHNQAGEIEELLKRATEAERKLAILKEAFDIITGKEAK